MGLNSTFRHQQIVQLPLPEAKNGQSEEAISTEGLKVGLSLLHDDIVMIDFDNKAVHHVRIEPTHEKAVNVHKLASQFGVSLQAADDLKSVSSEWNHFEVTEDIPVMMGMTKKITFYTALRYNKDGMEAISDPGSSLAIYGKYVLSSSESDHRCLQLTEVTQMQCSVFLSWYVKSTMIKAHERVNAFYKEKFVESMRGRKWT